MAILKHTYKVAISRIKRQNQRDEHPREYTIE